MIYDNQTKPNLKDESISDIKESEYSRGEHPNSLKNLKPFPKGVSNPLENLNTKLAESLSVGF